MVAAGELMAPKRGSVDPSRHRDEVFDLYSIPAFDAGEPDVVRYAIGPATDCGSRMFLLSKHRPHIRRAWVVGPERGRRVIVSVNGSFFAAPRLIQVPAAHAGQRRIFTSNSWRPYPASAAPCLGRAMFT